MPSPFLTLLSMLNTSKLAINIIKTNYSITCDARYVKEKILIMLFFALYEHPFSSRKHESRKNENWMLYRVLFKETDFSGLKPEGLQRIEDWGNNYPRKIFSYKIENDMYAAIL